MKNIRRPRDQSGFALILTISLLALLVLAVYGLSVLVKINGQVATASSYQVQARQNAMVGLAVARSELQKAAGPDSVVTGRSSIRAKTAANGCLMGVWTAATASPVNWLVSGNFAPNSARTIDYNAIPTDSDQNVTLVGPGTVTQAASGAGYARARKIEIPGSGTAGNGHYAFWVEDEGTKASLNVPASVAPASGTGKPLIADPRGEVQSFAFTSAVLPNVIATDQIRFVAPGAQMKSKFHDYASRSAWVNGSGSLRPGLFNINTTSEESWAAVLRAYDVVRAANAVALDTRVPDLAKELTGNLRTAKSSGKVTGGPFFSVQAFWSSKVVETSLSGAGISDVTQDEIQDAISPMLAVRSDTFRIRAYGDALNAATSAVEATAYCEAIVQRTQETIDGVLGRKFVITYFRWLGPDDI